jgi:hypothetical protein
MKFPFLVRCIDAEGASGLVIGKLYRVIGATASGASWFVDGDSYSWAKTRFELVEAASVKSDVPEWKLWRDVLLSDEYCCGGAALKKDCTYHKEAR